ncbi:hypothetical protein KSF78_0005420 [Schistosoma japonicum]|nr:hypothetical protein KSF78_0005420 [Schistosoma japonicum]
MNSTEMQMFNVVNISTMLLLLQLTSTNTQIDNSFTVWFVSNHHQSVKTTNSYYAGQIFTIWKVITRDNNSMNTYLE